jgi:hypothetical protein
MLTSTSLVTSCEKRADNRLHLTRLRARYFLGSIQPARYAILRVAGGASWPSRVAMSSNIAEDPRRQTNAQVGEPYELNKAGELICD